MSEKVQCQIFKRLVLCYLEEVLLGTDQAVDRC